MTREMYELALRRIVEQYGMKHFKSDSMTDWIEREVVILDLSYPEGWNSKAAAVRYKHLVNVALGREEL